ncbi:MAG: hypothetical protein JW927_21990 [Deltaproteobacteria bacterium]|nr:hypothetical protein [Deltaproteobacteria bacterium]
MKKTDRKADDINRINNSRERFITDISHQLKTPMTSLLMSIEMLHERGEHLPYFLDTSRRKWI